MMKKFLNYFGYGTNRDLDMIAHMVGRKKIQGVSGKMRGYELCIIIPKHFTDKVLKTAPIPRSARDLIVSGFGPDFNMYITRLNKNGITYGTLWKLTEDEYELVRNWELLEFGVQKDFIVEVETNDGKKVAAITHGFASPRARVKHVVTGPDYSDYIASREAMLKRADDVRQEALKAISNFPKHVKEDYDNVVAKRYTTIRKKILQLENKLKQKNKRR